MRKAAKETGVNPADVQGSGRGGRVTKSDMVNPTLKGDNGQVIATAIGQRIEKREPMTRLRKRIAERLLSATQETAMLTTFNEVNMKPLMDLRAKYKDQFEKRHGVKLGFMSLFVKAATEALKRFPAVNASIDGDDIVYHGYYDVGVRCQATVVWLCLSFVILTAWVLPTSKAVSVITPPKPVKANCLLKR